MMACFCPACLLPLKVKRLAHVKGLLMEKPCSYDGEVQGNGSVILDLHSPIAQFPGLFEPS